MDKKQSSKLDNCIVCPVCNSRHLFKKEKVDNGVFAANCECCGHFIKFQVKSDVNSKITVTINGQKYTVGNEYPPWTSLNSYLRKERISVGTKVMCREGGCGICMVEAKLYEPISDSMKSYPVNSCLCPLFMCDGLEITTIEGVNDVIPKRLAKYNGSQCGYCSPAQVMNMHALLDFNKGSVSMKEVEDAYDDVICRCTGYRPILDAMKSFAVDSSQKNKTTATDIEELGKMFCSKTGQRCHGKCHPEMGQKLQAISDNPGKKIRFVFGNTGSGVYKSDLDLANFDILMDLRGIKELYGIDFDPTVVLGAGLSITQLIDIFTRTKLETSFGYFTQIRNMLQRVATTSIRSLGCWAGNLMLKHLHPEFQSDIYVSLEAANVGLMIADKTGSTQIPIGQFLKTDMTNKVIVAMLLQSMSDDYIIRMYKVAQRAEARIAKDFVHAVQTENYLLGKELSDVKVIQGAMTTLATELIPDADIDPVEPSVGYRKNVAMGFLYTYFLEVLGNTAGSKFRSGAMPLQRPLSSGQQSYDTKPMEWPLTEPLMKLEAMNQTTGKAQYINDIPLHKPLYAAFVTSTVGNAKLQSMDPSKALSMPGVLKFITAKDILGTNNCSPPLDPSFLPEEVLCSGDAVMARFGMIVAGQALGMIVAGMYFNDCLCMQCQALGMIVAGQALGMIVAGMYSNDCLCHILASFGDDSCWQALGMIVAGMYFNDCLCMQAKLLGMIVAGQALGMIVAGMYFNDCLCMQAGQALGMIVARFKSFRDDSCWLSFRDDRARLVLVWDDDSCWPSFRDDSCWYVFQRLSMYAGQDLGMIVAGQALGMIVAGMYFNDCLCMQEQALGMIVAGQDLGMIVAGMYFQRLSMYAGCFGDDSCWPNFRMIVAGMYFNDCLCMQAKFGDDSCWPRFRDDSCWYVFQRLSCTSDLGMIVAGMYFNDCLVYEGQDLGMIVAGMYFNDCLCDEGQDFRDDSCWYAFQRLSMYAGRFRMIVAVQVCPGQDLGMIVAGMYFNDCLVYAAALGMIVAGMYFNDCLYAGQDLGMIVAGMYFNDCLCAQGKIRGDSCWPRFRDDSCWYAFSMIVYGMQASFRMIVALSMIVHVHAVVLGMIVAGMYQRLSMYAGQDLGDDIAGMYFNDCPCMQVSFRDDSWYAFQ
ncbi:XDH [Mytilus edulis]|uniref:XDH n=1 Tax=Mytilus edulis TaxID=6550 RepID=A0A8S3T8I7_MYTED|nr:XDH [Mytilus edulis]